MPGACAAALRLQLQMLEQDKLTTAAAVPETAEAPPPVSDEVRQTGSATQTEVFRSSFLSVKVLETQCKHCSIALAGNTVLLPFDLTLTRLLTF